MKALKDRVRRQLDDLSPEELRAVHQLIESFQEKPPAQPSAAPAARQVRRALADLPGSLTATIREEREDRV